MGRNPVFHTAQREEVADKECLRWWTAQDGNLLVRPGISQWQQLQLASFLTKKNVMGTICLTG